MSQKANIMPGKAGFRIHAPWPRPEAALLAAFAAASSAQVADSMSRLGAMDTGIRPIWPAPRIVGPALTAWCHAGDNLMLHKALALAQPGDIVLCNTQASANAVFGELMASCAVKLGVRGVIVDGTVRDAEALRALQLPVYGRGLSPNGCNKDGAGEVGGAIACGGVAVCSGDIVIADCDGITVVPYSDAAAVAKLAAAQIAREKSRLAEIEQGVLVKAEIDDTLKRLKIIE